MCAPLAKRGCYHGMPITLLLDFVSILGEGGGVFRDIVCRLSGSREGERVQGGGANMVVEEQESSAHKFDVKSRLRRAHSASQARRPPDASPPITARHGPCQRATTLKCAVKL